MIQNAHPHLIGGNYHVFRRADEQILFSVDCSMVIEILDDELFELLSEYEKLEGKKICSAYDLLDRKDWPEETKKKLQKDLRLISGYTIRNNGNSSQEVPIINNADPQKDIFLPSITLMLSEACNLRCKYCYTGLQTDKYQSRLMSEEVAKQAINFQINKMGQHVKYIRVMFFGGEPLLNQEVLKATIEYVKTKSKELKKPCKFGLTTNGTLLDKELIKYLVDNKVVILVSLDGDAATHDSLRKFPDGSGSHQMIMKQLGFLCEYSGSLSTRATWTRNGPSIGELCKYFKSIGATTLLISPVMSTEDNSPNKEFKLERADHEKMWMEYQSVVPSIYQDLINGKFPIFDPLTSNFRFFNQTTPNKLAYQCNGGLGGIAIGTDGSIYPCHRFWGMDNFLLGNIYKGFDTIKYKAFWQKYYDKVTHNCVSCWARYLCLGGCMRRNALENGNFLKPAKWVCKMYLRALELQIAYFAKMSKDSPATVAKICGLEDSWQPRREQSQLILSKKDKDE